MPRFLLAVAAVPFLAVSASAEPPRLPHDSAQKMPVAAAKDNDLSVERKNSGVGKKAQIQPASTEKCKLGVNCRKAKTQQPTVGQ